jgi:cytochrome c
MLRATLTLALLLGSGLVAAQPLAPQELAEKSGCMACHGMVRQQIGPGFAQIAARYRADADAPTRLAGKIRNGSVGTWGRVIMPRHPQLTEADALALVRWVLSQP